MVYSKHIYRTRYRATIQIKAESTQSKDADKEFIESKQTYLSKEGKERSGWRAASYPNVLGTQMMHLIGVRDCGLSIARSEIATQKMGSLRLLRLLFVLSFFSFLGLRNASYVSSIFTYLAIPSSLSCFFPSHSPILSKRYPSFLSYYENDLILLLANRFSISSLAL